MTYKTFCTSVLANGLLPSRDVVIARWFIEGGKFNVWVCFDGKVLHFKRDTEMEWTKGSLAEAVALARQSPQEAKILAAAAEVCDRLWHGRSGFREVVESDIHAILRKHFGDGT